MVESIVLEDIPITNTPVIETIPYAGMVRLFKGINACPPNEKIHHNIRARIARIITDSLKHPNLVWLRWFLLLHLPLPLVKVYDPARGNYLFAIIDAEKLQEADKEWWSYRGYRVEIKKFDGLPDLWVLQPSPIQVNWFYDARKFWITREG